jgi:hypothetical protein
MHGYAYIETVVGDWLTVSDYGGCEEGLKNPNVLHNLFLSASHWLHCCNLFTHSPGLPFLEHLTLEGGIDTPS